MCTGLTQLYSVCTGLTQQDGHYQVPKHVVVPHVENTLYCTNKYICFRLTHILYISLIERARLP